MIDIVWQSIVIHGLSYLIFAFLLGKILFDPVMSLIEKRSERVNKLVTAAERAEEEAKSLQDSLERRLYSARIDAGTIMEELRLAAEAQGEEQIAQMREKVQQFREENAAELSQEIDKAMAEVESYAKELGRMLAEKALDRKLVA
ncbi:MAG: ATP synthase F0 subunit B [Firmicutes bacterium]|nr:ATP synthase F0 subunit B [Bacillota bacterium]